MRRRQSSAALEQEDNIVYEKDIIVFFSNGDLET